MYIPPFWCGVAATILAEIIAGVVVGVVSSLKTKKK